MRIDCGHSLFAISGSVLVAVLLLGPPAAADPYVFPGPPVVPAAGSILPAPGSVEGKEFSHAADRDQFGALDAEQNVAFDGVGGVMDGIDYSGLPFDDREVDAIAHVGDALFNAVRADSSYLLFSVGNGVSPTGSGSFVTSEGETIGMAGDISYEKPGAITKGIWAPGSLWIDRGTPLLDVDGLEIWGAEPPNFDSDHYSLQLDITAGATSIWSSTGIAYVSQPTIANAVIDMLGPLSANVDVDDIDLDAMMILDLDGVPEQFGGPGDALIFSIRQLKDDAAADGFYATGSEIFTLDANAAGLFPGFLLHGGHRWDKPYALAAMKDINGRQLDVNALEAASVPEPGTISLAVLALSALGVWRWRRRRR